MGRRTQKLLQAFALKLSPVGLSVTGAPPCLRRTSLGFYEAGD